MESQRLRLLSGGKSAALDAAGLILHSSKNKADDGIVHDDHQSIN